MPLNVDQPIHEHGHRNEGCDHERPVVGRRDAAGEVHALRGPGFASVQFHPESVLSLRGPALVAELLAGVPVQVG